MYGIRDIPGVAAVDDDVISRESLDRIGVFRLAVLRVMDVLESFRDRADARGSSARMVLRNDHA